MMGRSHLAIGSALSMTTMLALGPDPVQAPSVFVVGLFVGSVASLLPDIDGDPGSPADPLVRTMFGVGNTQTKRQFWRHLKRGNAVGLLVTLVQRVIAMVLNLFAAALPHRGVTHWAVVAVCLSALVMILCLLVGAPTLFALSFFVGYMSHIIADMMTKSGVPVLAPFGPAVQGKPTKYHLLPPTLRLRTGSFTEKIVVGLFLAGMLPIIMLLYAR